MGSGLLTPRGVFRVTECDWASIGHGCVMWYLHCFVSSVSSALVFPARSQVTGGQSLLFLFGSCIHKVESLP